jgi:hypothetical protein
MAIKEEKEEDDDEHIKNILFSTKRTALEHQSLKRVAIDPNQ